METSILVKKLDNSRKREVLYLTQEYDSATESQMINCFYDILTYYSEPENAQLYGYSIEKQSEIALDVINQYSTIENKSLAQKLLQESLEVELKIFRKKVDNTWDKNENLAYQKVMVAILSKTGKNGLAIAESINSFNKTQCLKTHWKMLIWPKSLTDRTIYPAFFYALANALFKDKVYSEYNHELKKNSSKYTGISSEVFDSIKNAFFTPSNMVSKNDIENSTYLHSKTGRTLAIVDMSSIKTLAEIQKNIPLLNTSNAHKLIDYVLKQSQFDFFFKTSDDPFNIVIEGGIAELLKRIKSPVHGKNTKEIREILRTGQALLLKTSTREIGGIWTFDLTEPKGQKKSQLTITLGNAFRPHYQPFKKSFIIPITNLPPAVGARKFWGFQYAFHKYVIAEIVNNHRMNLLNHGGAHLTPSKLKQLANQCGLPITGASGLQNLWKKWTESDEKIFNEVKQNYYEIADSEQELSKAIKMICAKSLSGVKKISHKNPKRSYPLVT